MNAVARVGLLRRELAQAERLVRERAKREAVRLVRLEKQKWRKAQEKCFQLEKIRRDVRSRLDKLDAGASERFLGERELAEMALRDLDRWELWDSAEYTVISFVHRRDKLRFIMGGAQREAVIRETVERGGVYDDRHHFIGILM